MSRAFAALLSLVGLLFVLAVGGAVEGRWFPVTGPVSLFAPQSMPIHTPDPSPAPPHGSRWQGVAVKRRNCEIVRVEWYLGPRNGRRVLVPFEFHHPPEPSAVGQLEWAGLSIWLPPSQVAANSHADVLHRCAHRPWLVRTRYFDAEAAASV